MESSKLITIAQCSVCCLTFYKMRPGKQNLMTEKPIELSLMRKLEEKHPGKWVALTSEGGIVAVAKSEEELMKEIRDRLREEELIVLYAQTEEERRAQCLLMLPSSTSET